MVDFKKIQDNISKLTDDWKKWAEEADEKAGEKFGGKKDGIYLNSAFEIDYVKNKALKSGVDKKDVVSVFQGLGIEETEMNGIMDGTFFKNTKKSEKATNKEARVIKSDAQQNIIRNYINNSSKNFIKTGNWDDLAKYIDDKIKNDFHTDPEYYEKLGEQVKVIINEFKTATAAFGNKEYDSKDDVMAMYKKISENESLYNDEFGDFKKELTEALGSMVEARQLQKETDRVNKRFKDCIEKEHLSREDALKKVREEFKDKGSYYNDFKGYSIKEISHQDELYEDAGGETIVPSHKGILTDMEDKIVLKHASDEVDKIIQDLKKQKGDNDEKITAKDIENAAIEILKKNGTYDKYAKKYMRGRTEMTTSEILLFEKSPYKYSRKNTAATRRANAIIEKPFTYTELRKQVKSDDTFVERLLNKEVTLLDEKGNPVKDKKTGEYVKIKAITQKDGKYNIEGLSMFIRRTIGKDLLASKEPSKINVYDEISNVARALGVSDKEAKHLIKMCGYDLDSKNWAKIFMTAFVDTVLGYIPGATLSTLGLANSIGNQIISGQTFNFFKEFLVANLKYNNSQNWSIGIGVDGINVEYDEEDIITQLKTQTVNYTIWDDSTQSFVTTQEPLLNFMDYDIVDGKLILTYNKPSTGEINFFGKVDEEAKTPDQKVKDAGIDTSEGLPIQLLKGFAIAFAINVLKEATKVQGTKPILNPDFDTSMSMDDYIETHIKNNANIKDPKLKTALIGLVNNFCPMTIDKETGELVQGKWNAEDYRNMLSTIAGPSSHLTAIELYDYLKEILPKKEEATTPPPPPPETKPETKQEVKQEVKADTGLEVKRVLTPQELNPIAFTRWNDVVNGYSCLKKPEFANTKMKSGASLSNRITKILQVISAKEGDDAKVVFNVRTIADFAIDADKIGTKNKAKLQELANSEKYAPLNIDVDKYLALMGSDIGMVGGVLAPPLYDPQDEKDGDDGVCSHDGHKGAPLKKDELGGKGAGIQVQKKVVNGEVKYFERPVGTTEWKPSNEATYNDPKNKKVQ